MTLLIGTVSDTHVFLTADRRCTVVKRDGTVFQRDKFQKIFDVPGKPLAVVHHGENIFLDEARNEIPLDQFITAFIRDDPDVFEQPSFTSITENLAEALESAVRRTLSERGKKLIGFWVAGFAKGSVNPELWEVCWFKDGRKAFKCGNTLFVGGDGGEHLPPRVRDRLDSTCNLDSIPKASVERMRRYHDKLFTIALKAEPEPRRFSDDKQQLVIEKMGCRWAMPPVGHSSAPLGPRNRNTHA